jgi:hypothetical protein
MCYNASPPNQADATRMEGSASLQNLHLRLHGGQPGAVELVGVDRLAEPGDLPRGLVREE